MSASAQAAELPAIATRSGPRLGAKILVLGLGNDLLCDDAVGLRVAAEVRRRTVHWQNVEVVETIEMGLSLLDLIADHTDLLLIDSVQTGKVPAGFLHELEGGDLKKLPLMSPHFLGVGEVLALGRELGFPVPQRVKVFAIEVADPYTVSLQMTAALETAVPGIVEHVTATLLKLVTGDLSLAGDRRDAIRKP